MPQGFVYLQFTPDKCPDQYREQDADGQPKYINERMEAVFPDMPPRYFKGVLYHT
jgi:hypothetical protein